MQVREMFLLDETGHSEFSWTPDSDEAMIGFIQAKMDKGVTFFILEPRKILSFLPPKQIALDSAKDALATRTVVVHDPDMQKLIDQGHPINTKAITSGSDSGSVVRKAANANDVATNRSYGVRRMAGG